MLDLLLDLPFVVVPYLLAQIRAASRASELNCSYSLETMWTQRGNSSTLARLRPRSKMRILGSGTPRLKRDFGYGYSLLESLRNSSSTDVRVCASIAVPKSAYLVLAVAITSRGSSGHLDGLIRSSGEKSGDEEAKNERRRRG
jgi:hypothetical protein